MPEANYRSWNVTSLSGQSNLSLSADPHKHLHNGWVCIFVGPWRGTGMSALHALMYNSVSSFRRKVCSLVLLDLARAQWRPYVQHRLSCEEHYRARVSLALILFSLEHTSCPFTGRVSCSSSPCLSLFFSWKLAVSSDEPSQEEGEGTQCDPKAVAYW